MNDMSSQRFYACKDAFLFKRSRKNKSDPLGVLETQIQKAKR